MEQDPRFAFRILVDIASKALSPNTFAVLYRSLSNFTKCRASSSTSPSRFRSGGISTVMVLIR